MQSDPESPFELLEPPPGGVERMRARLAAPEPLRGGFRLAAAGVATLVVLTALLAVMSDVRFGRDTGDGTIAAAPDNAILAAPELDRLLGREAQPVPLTVERDGQPQQVEELPSADPRVRIYRTL
jgi:hypothetical protein